jgi:hypothetical protein
MNIHVDDMTKAERIIQYKAKRQKLKTDIENAIKRRDSKEKFEQLIKLTKDYEKITTDMNLDGIPAKVWPEKLSSKKWIDTYERFIQSEHEAIKQEKKTRKSIKPVENQSYSITLCWTIKNEYCVCDAIIETIQKYFSSIGLTDSDTTQTKFPDRIEFCQEYKLSCTKDKYELILKSAEYILEIATNSAYEQCNVGLFGRIC